MNAPISDTSHKKITLARLACLCFNRCCRRRHRHSFLISLMFLEHSACKVVRLCCRGIPSKYSCRCLIGLSDLERAYSKLLGYTNRGYVPLRFITGSLGVSTRRRRRKLLTASCSLLLLRDWRASSRTSSRSSPTLG